MCDSVSQTTIAEQESKESRLRLGDAEMTRVLGGGVVKGSLVLVGGEPGIGKSTLMLQVAAALAGGNGTDEGPALYVSGEESVAQVQHHISQPYVPLYCIG
jgi:DNA repair protein RadA/Sms